MSVHTEAACADSRSVGGDYRTAADTDTPQHTDAQPNGWRAELHLGFARIRGRTRLSAKSQLGPLTVQRPFYPEGETCHLYLLHPPGGVVGGDRLRLDVDVARSAHALLTTPGAGKFYRSDSPSAGLEQKFTIHDGGVLEWLPQETILFGGARASLSSRIELRGEAAFIGWEIHCFGRPAASEAFDHGQVRLSLSLYRNGRPLLLERLAVGGGDTQRPAGLRGHPVSATLLATRVKGDTLAEVNRVLHQRQDVTAGATLLDDLLVLRCLGTTTEPVRRLLEQVWRTIRPGLLSRQSCAPRVWNT